MSEVLTEARISDRVLPSAASEGGCLRSSTVDAIHTELLIEKNQIKTKEIYQKIKIESDHMIFNVHHHSQLFI